MHETKPAKLCFYTCVFFIGFFLHTVANVVYLHCYTTGTSGIYVGSLGSLRRKKFTFTVSSKGPADIIMDFSRTFRLGKCKL